MQAKLLDHARMKNADARISSGREIGWGITGGLAATMIMDLILIIAFTAAGLPPFTCFSIVGDTVAYLFPAAGMANNVPLGVAAHYLIGPGLGAIFGAAARSAPALQVGSWKKSILFAVLFAEVASQPLLALAPIFLRMTASETLEWFGGSFVMHLIWGCVLGAVWMVCLNAARKRQIQP